MTRQMNFMRLVRDQQGAVIIEFAILGPLVIGLMLAVFQIGMGMQAYNSMRSIAGETARYAVVEFQQGETELTLTNDEIEAQAVTIATSSPYNLDDTVDISANDAPVAEQTVAGARKINVTITYTVPLVLPFFDWASPTLTHSRPIYVID